MLVIKDASQFQMFPKPRRPSKIVLSASLSHCFA
jgi:hypothetical protein